MVRINSLDQIQDAVKHIRDFKKGYFTNLFIDNEKFDLWIKKEIFYYLPGDGVTLFLKKNEGFFNVYYCSYALEILNNEISSLTRQYKNEIFVFDIIGIESVLEDTIRSFASNGYNIYTKLNRMSRLIKEEESNIQDDSICYATADNLKEIQLLLKNYFDKYAEQLPLDEEIASWIEKSHLLLYVEDEKIIGFVIFDIIGVTSYLRYWFVHPMHRNKKVGSSLLRRFFYESRNSKRQLFWVIANNINAIQRYQHYGFANENLVDFVLINVNKQYEDRNN